MKAKRLLLKIILFITLFFWILITYTSIFDVYFSDNITTFPILVIIGTIVFWGCLKIIYDFIGRLKEKTHDTIAIVLSIIMLVVMLIWGLTHQILTTYDLNHIISKVYNMTDNNGSFFAHDYFSIYPAQIPITLLLYFISRIGKLFTLNINNTLVIYNCIMTSLGACFLYKIVKKKQNSKIGLIAIIIMFLYPDFYLFASYYYTDIVSIPYAIIGYYFLLLGESDKKESYIYLILSVFFLFISFLIRVPSFFIFIGYIVYKSLTTKKINYKKASTVIISFIIIFIPYKMLNNKYISPTIDSTKTIPFTHFIMMGTDVKANGGYTADAVNYTVSSNNKIQDNLSVIKENIKDISDEFLLTKLKRTWSNGEHDILRKYKNNTSIDYTYEYLTRQNSVFIKYIDQILKVTIYVLFLMTIYKAIVLNKSEYGEVIITIFGGIIFYLFWEGLTRYSFTFLPFLIIGASGSIEYIKKLFNTTRIKVEKKEINLAQFKRIIGITILILTMVMLISGFNKYTIKQQPYNKIVHSEYSYNNYIPLIKNKIRNDFYISKSFNRIELAFSVTGEKNIKNYLELYDSNNILITKKVFSSNWATSNSTKTFEIPDQIIGEEKLYHLVIYSEKATEDSHLSVAIYGNNPKNVDAVDDYINDVDTKSILYNDDEKTNNSLRFKLINYQIVSLMSKKVFIIITIFIIILEYFGIYKLLIKKQKN